MVCNATFNNITVISWLSDFIDGGTQHNMCWTPNSFRKIVKEMSTNYYTITLSDHINIYS
jgi:hypothetical protein